MPYFENDGVKIYYEIEGSGPDLIIIHGFMVNMELDWKQFNWVNTLKEENRLIFVDCRGHGKSDKPKDPNQYGGKTIEDITKLMDFLSIKRANFLGYSRGSGITLQILLDHPDRVNSAVLGGYALSTEESYNLSRKGSRIGTNTFTAKHIDDIKNPISKGFRMFAEEVGIDLEVAAAMTSGPSNINTRTYSEMKEALGKISVPVMTVVGCEDNLFTGDKTRLCKLIPKACHFELEGRDHLSTRSSKRTKFVVKAFLKYVNESYPK
ncbi:MAG: alpha/beta fold hydrolase [Promethearchaeota archaeon]